jgi:hypothetical protein
MNLEILKNTDSELLEMLEVKSTTREARTEITRRKAVGAWRLIAGFKFDPEIKEPEEVIIASPISAKPARKVEKRMTGRGR